MAVDLYQASELIQSALLRELGDEVELILYFGSHFRRETHQYSDLDICYIPSGESTWNHITVLVNDRLIDLFAIHWSQFEQMAEFGHVNCTILLNSQIVYRRTEEAAARFEALRERFRDLQKPQARPLLQRKAQEIFQDAAYQYYLVQQAAAQNRSLAAMRHAQETLKTILHCLAVLNQACIDTRKLDQILTLPKLPDGFEEAVNEIMTTADPNKLQQATGALLSATRSLLLLEQTQQRASRRFAEVFEATYPEFKANIQHLMLACERENPFTFELMSLYHELMIHMTYALTGINYSKFNSIADYEQDLAALGFPDLLPYIEIGDFAGLHEQCQLFDQRLQEYLTEQGVPLNSFATLDELQAYLDSRTKSAA